MLQRRPGGHARAQQRRHGAQLEVFRHADHEFAVDDDVIGIAAEGFAADDFLFAVIGRGKARFAILLLTAMALRAVAAGVDHDADADQIARFHVADRVAGADNAPDNFMARHQRELADAPLVTRHMQVRMADAAVVNVDQHVARLYIAAGKFERFQRGVSCFGSESRGVHSVYLVGKNRTG